MPVQNRLTSKARCHVNERTLHKPRCSLHVKIDSRFTTVEFWCQREEPHSGSRPCDASRKHTVTRVAGFLALSEGLAPLLIGVGTTR